MNNSPVIYDSLNQAFACSMKLLNEEGKEVNSRGSKQKELLFHNMIIKDPYDLHISVPARKFNHEYAVAEWLWYLSRSPNVKNIGKMASIWNDIKDRQSQVESNYGSYLYHKPGMVLGCMGPSQWEWVINELMMDKDSRRATIVINQPYHKHKNSKDYPCTQYLHFFIRDNMLHMSANMRSNDAVFGFCNDVYTFCLTQQMMWNEMVLVYPGLKMGHYYHSAGSFHIYERHFPMMKKISENYFKKVVEKNGWPQATPVWLRHEVRYQTVEEFKYGLPMDDIDVEQIKQFTYNTIERLFYEHPEKS